MPPFPLPAIIMIAMVAMTAVGVVVVMVMAAIARKEGAVALAPVMNHALVMVVMAVVVEDMAVIVVATTRATTGTGTMIGTIGIIEEAEKAAEVAIIGAIIEGTTITTTTMTTITATGISTATAIMTVENEAEAGAEAVTDKAEMIIFEMGQMAIPT